MDTITAMALSFQDPVLHFIGIMLDSALLYAVLIFAVLYLVEKRDEKRRKVAASLVLTFLAVAGLKFVMGKERPCAAEGWCPGDYSFPSMHAAIAFTLMTGFLNKKSFPLFLLFALFVSFTRLNLGVHVFVDIAGALPVAMVSYYVTDIFWRDGHGGRD